MMPTPAPVTVLTETVLAENYDLGSIDRGIAYADDGRARLISSAPGTLNAIVEGSGRNTYVVRVAWRELAGGVVIDDSCTCPLGGFCKHAVATILTAQSEARAAADDLDDAHGPSWRRVLDDLVDDDDRVGNALDGPGPLALQFSVVTSGARTYPRDTAPRLSVRPMRLGKRGNWVKTGASWRDLYYAHGTGDLDAGQVAALRALWNASPRHSYYPDTGPMTFDRFGSELWIHLRNVAASGVAFVDESGQPTIELSDEPASIEVDLTRDDTGTVRLVSQVVVDNDPIEGDTTAFGFIGSPPHGLFTEAVTGELVLAALDKPLSPGALRLLSSPPLRVPAGEVDELLDLYQPVLARRATLRSSDGSVAITHRRFDGLTLRVERRAVDVVATTWQARYVRGETVTRRGLYEPGGGERDREAERAAMAGLVVPEGLRDLLVGPGGMPTATTLRGAEVVRLFTEAVPWLTDSAGVEVAVVVDEAVGQDLPELREATADPLVELEVSDADTGTGQTDWFDLTVNVTVDGEKVPFAALFTALARDESVLVLSSGTWVRLERREFDRLRALIEEARGLLDTDPDADDDTVRINRFQISLFEELAALGVVTAQSTRWAANLADLGALTAPEPVVPPSTLKAELRPYQAEGLAWLEFIRASGLGGILADDMGLGKTVQVLSCCAAILEERPDARFLVVAPTSVVDNWKREANRFVPTMSVATVTGTAKRRGSTLTDAIDGASLVVTSYTLFRLEFDDYASLDWELLLLDEAQYVKNYQGKTYSVVRRLPARSKIAITGTPLENSLMDLWSLLSIVAPGLYPDPDRFSRVYRKPIEKGEAPELLATLRRRIAPLMRRRTKAEVLTELPPKIEQVVEVDMHPKHKRIYQTRLQRERAKVLGLATDVQRNRFVIFKSLTLLRQLSLDPGLIDEADDHIGSAKLDRLVEDLDQIVAEGHRALVFSQFTRYLRRAEQRLGDAGIDTVYLDGRTRRRAEVIDSFKSGQVPVFLISLKAGGVGLNLAEADYCFILDPWWNPAAESQAVDRAHRIGQANTVVVYRYVSTGTIEEKVMELKARKAALFADVVDADGALSGALTEDDIRGLFDAG